MRHRRAPALLLVVLVAGACAGASGVTARDARPSDQGARPASTVPRTTTPPPTTPGTTQPTPTQPGTTTAGGAGTIAWGSCASFDDVFTNTDMVGLDRDDLECATVAVPLDYGDPELGTIDLAVARLPAGDPERRIGSLFLNPGGPGGSGLEFLPQFASIADDELLDRFDVVAFDPRGVSASTPIECLTDEEREAGANEDPTPDDEQELQASLDSLAAQNASCVQQFPDLVPRMGTRSVVRDLEVLRQAVGDERLTYLGLSYGTLIGAVYAEMFPDKVRALVLDGSLSPTSGLEVLRDGQFEGFTRAYANFVAACAADGDCPLDDADAAARQLVEQAAREPIPTLDPARPLTEGRAYTALAASLYDAESWPFVWDGIEQALGGNAAVLAFLADLYAGRRIDGTWSNSDESFNAVTCADYPERPTFEQIEPRAQEILAEDPFWGPLFAWNPLLCEGSAVAADPIPPALTAPGAPPILVVGTTGDPATPYAWAEQMAASLVSGVLLTYEGDGHTAFGSSTCATAAMNEYLLDLTVPPDGQVCTS